MVFNTFKQRDIFHCILIFGFLMYWQHIKHRNVSLEELKTNSTYMHLLDKYQYNQFTLFVYRNKKNQMKIHIKTFQYLEFVSSKFY